MYFYSKYQPYYEFSNFYENSQFQLDGEKWKSSEHYFQAQKFIATPYKEMVKEANTPREAFELSRRPNVSRWKRSDWEEVKLLVMYKALLAKFIENERLRVLLHSTGKRKLVEHTSNDSYWGDGGILGRGSNYLGKLLENVRSVVRKEANVPHKLIK